MGNRAVITTKENFENNGVGVYVHWNGSINSVKAFLTYCKDMGFRAPDSDSYGWARLCEVIANYFGDDGLSVGIDTIDKLDCDNGDNGTYIIEGWEIVDIKYNNRITIDSYDEENVKELIRDITASQPWYLSTSDFRGITVDRDNFVTWFSNLNIDDQKFITSLKLKSIMY